MGASALVGSSVIGAVSSYQSGRSAQKGAGKASDATLQAAREAEALNRERYERSEQLLNPYLERELQASNQLLSELGLTPYATPGATGGPEGDSAYLPVRNLPAGGAGNYRNAPGYAASFDALGRLEEEGIDAVNQGAAGSGTLYSGRRGEALRDVGADTQLARAQTENQFYNNYINTLQNLANPSATTNLSSLGVGQGANIGSQNIASTNAANQFQLQGTQARGAATADIFGGIANLGSAYIQSGGFNKPAAPASLPPTGSQFPSSAYI